MPSALDSLWQTVQVSEKSAILQRSCSLSEYLHADVILGKLDSAIGPDTGLSSDVPGFQQHIHWHFAARTSSAYGHPLTDSTPGRSPMPTAIESPTTKSDR
ncbi:hypothetical protein CSPX01_01289 [Colletotrichum filicis]|nr:hypothetical protein CSPX01_01289 [Colletotrichum filicis]